MCCGSMTRRLHNTCSLIDVRPRKPKLPSSVEEIAEGDDDDDEEDDDGEDNEGLGWSDRDYQVM